MGEDRAREIVEDEDRQQMFRDEFEKLKADRTMLREDILKTADEALRKGAPMPVNLPRIITNIKALNQIKPSSVSDIDPRHYFE